MHIAHEHAQFIQFDCRTVSARRRCRGVPSPEVLALYASATFGQDGANIAKACSCSLKVRRDGEANFWECSTALVWTMASDLSARGSIPLRWDIPDQERSPSSAFNRRNRCEARPMVGTVNEDNLFQELRQPMARTAFRSGDPNQGTLRVSARKSHL